MKRLLIAGAAMAALASAGAAHAAFPNIGSNTNGPALIITIAANGTASISNGLSTGPYDNSDDTYIGVVNNQTSATVSTLHLTSSGADIFGFDGDGIDTGLYLNIPNNAMDSSGYGGPNAYFTVNSLTDGLVNFITPIAANGGTDYFSLEEPLDTATFTGGGGGITNGTPEPGTWAMMLIGIAGLGGMLRLAGRKAVTA